MIDNEAYKPVVCLSPEMSGVGDLQSNFQILYPDLLLGKSDIRGPLPFRLLLFVELL